MKVFVATKEKQGERASDFFWAREGELVTFGSVCGNGRCDVDDGCGCQRSMIGVATRKGTTTVKVVSKRTLTEDDYIRSLLASFCKAYRAKADDPKVVAEVTAEAKELLRIADAFDTDDVVEVRGNQIQVRNIKAE